MNNKLFIFLFRYYYHAIYASLLTRKAGAPHSKTICLYQQNKKKKRMFDAKYAIMSDNLFLYATSFNNSMQFDSIRFIDVEE